MATANRTAKRHNSGRNCRIHSLRRCLPVSTTYLNRKAFLGNFSRLKVPFKRRTQQHVIASCFGQMPEHKCIGKKLQPEVVECLGLHFTSTTRLSSHLVFKIPPQCVKHGKRHKREREYAVPKGENKQVEKRWLVVAAAKAEHDKDEEVLECACDRDNAADRDLWNNRFQRHSPLYQHTVITHFAVDTST